MHVCIGDKEPAEGAVTGWTIAALTLPILINVISRKGALLLNNTFAVAKVAILLVIMVLRFTNARGKKGALENFQVERSFADSKHDLASYAHSLMFTVYSFSGFKQPFYVLGEAYNPQRVFPKYTALALVIAIVLFFLVNVSYLCVVPAGLPNLTKEPNIAILFFRRVFDSEAAARVMSSIIAFSIFSNILVITYIASRVKQEIAKEAVIPASLFFAPSYTTPIQRWRLGRVDPNNEEPDADYTPMPALLLH